MKRFAVLLLLPLALSGCGKFAFHRPDSIQEKIEYAEQAAADNHYEDARKNWEEVRDAYLSPELTALAEIKVAEIHFLQQQYVEATAGYEAFLKAHPLNSRAEDVLFRLAVCYQRQMLDPERDQTFTRKARETFRRYLDTYPDTPRHHYAEEMIARCNNRLAAHEVTVARYYLQHQNYDAAIARLGYVLENYPHFSERRQVTALLNEAQNRGFGETAISRLMDRLYHVVMENETVNEMKASALAVFQPVN